MSSRIRLILCATAAVVSVSGPQKSFAQADQPAAAPVSGLEEVVVTARRREERVQTVPLAVTALSQAKLEQQGVRDVSDLVHLVPSMGATTTSTDQTGVYPAIIRIRGLPGATVYFADVPIASDMSLASGYGFSRGPISGSMYDLQDVEVIKGPQGTLFGKNSVGGLISYQPQRPTNNYEGYLKATFGNYNDKEVEGAINIPIVDDKVLLRVAGQMQQRDGYTHDLSDNTWIDNENHYAWRAGLTLRPTDDLENYTVYDGYWQDQYGGVGILTRLNPAFAVFSLAPGLPPATLGVGPDINGFLNPATAAATLAAAEKAGGFALYPGIAKIAQEDMALGPRAFLGSPYQHIGKSYFYGVTNVTHWDLQDDLTIKNIASIRFTKALANQELGVFAPTVPILQSGQVGNPSGWIDDHVQYTEELQLQGKAIHDKLSWIAGVYGEFIGPNGFNTIGTTAFGNTFIGSTGYTHDHSSSRSRAVFAHGDYDLGDYVEGLKFTAGYRYTWDDLSTQQWGTQGSPMIIRGANGVPKNCAGLFNVDNNCYQSEEEHFGSYGWNVSLEEQLTPETLLYVRSGNAYRPGGISLNVPVQFSKLQPEHVTDVEIGAKTDWNIMGIHGRTNADLFHTDYKAIQVSQVIVFQTSAGTPVTGSGSSNAGSATLQGAELEFTVLPIESLELTGHWSYLDAHYQKYPALFTAGVASLGSNTSFLYEPRTSYSLTGTYHLPIDASYGDLAFSTTYTFYGHQVNSVAIGEILQQQPSYRTIDMRLDWTNIFGYPVDFGAFARNVANSTYEIDTAPTWIYLGYDAATYNPPRMFGFSLKYRFKPETEEAATTAAYTPPPVQAPVPAAPKSYLVFFDFDKSDLTPQASEIVDQAAANAGPAKVTRLTVTGHTDTVGSDAYNMRLSRRRAESVAARLEKDGIPSSEIEIVAKGKRDLLVPTADGVREPQNRRVQIVYDGGPGA